MATAQIEPFDFFSMDSFKAGWYLYWRLFLSFLAVMFAVGLITGAGAALGKPLGQARAAAAVTFAVMMLASIYPMIVLTNKFASGWAVKKYGRQLPAGVWWGISWRVALVGLGMSVGTVVVHTLFGATFAFIAKIAASIVAIGQTPLSIMAVGWAMSVMVAKQLQGSAPLTAVTRPRGPTAAPAARERGTVQCPKCMLYETERGTVIGWYCRICGWRESRP